MAAITGKGPLASPSKWSSPAPFKWGPPTHPGDVNFTSSDELLAGDRLGPASELNAGFSYTPNPQVAGGGAKGLRAPMLSDPRPQYYLPPSAPSPEPKPCLIKSSSLQQLLDAGAAALAPRPRAPQPGPRRTTAASAASGAPRPPPPPPGSTSTSTQVGRVFFF